MGLEDVGRITFPEHFAPFFDDILREIPTIAVPMHTHLHHLVSFQLSQGLYNYAYRLY
jgi:hypothetical protein